MNNTALPEQMNDELRDEIDLGYRSSKPNPCAVELEASEVLVELAPDVAEVFDSAEAVSRVLRVPIQNMPP